MATWAQSLWQPGAVFRPRRDETLARTAAVAVDADPFALTGLPNDDVYFFSKRVDNSRLVRQADTHVKGEWSAIAGVCTVALLIGGMMVAPGVTSVMDSIKIQELKREQTQLRNDQRRLEVEHERLINAARMEALAPSHNLVRPGADQIIRLQPKNNHSFASNGLKPQ